MWILPIFFISAMMKKSLTKKSSDEELMNSAVGRITKIVYKGSHNHPKPQQQLAIKPAKESISDSEDQGSPCVVESTGPGDSENEDGVGDEPNLKKRHVPNLYIFIFLFILLL